MSNSKFWLITGLILITVISRLIPHVFNVTPLIAVALFAGAKFQDKKWAIIIPMVSLFLSDVLLAYINNYPLLHNTILFTYGSIFLIILLGRVLNSEKINVGKTVGVTLFSSLLFFIISNFGVWLFGNMYTMNIAGFIQCYVMAIPFNKFSWIGDLAYVFAIFGVYELVSNKYFASAKDLITENSNR